MKPRLAFAMGSDQLRAALFGYDAMERLRQVTEGVTVQVLSEFDSPGSRKALAEVDVLITGWGSPVIDEAILDVAPRLRLIAHAGGTVKQHVAPACWDRGVTVTTAAQANAIPVAEYTLAVILLAGKNTFAHADALHLQRSSYRVDSLGADVGNRGSTVGIIGASRIGRLVLGLLQPFNFRVLLTDPTISPVTASNLGAELVSLSRLMAESKVVSLHAPVLPSTVGMIGEAELSAMKNGATFINTARGVLVDHDALRAELSKGRINAVLDVTEPQPLDTSDALYDMPNVMLTPHIAGSLGNEMTRMGDAAAVEVERFAAGLLPEAAIARNELDDMA